MILYPLILAKTRIQASGGRKDSDSALEALLRVLRRTAASGPVGLYQGLSAQLVKGFVSQGVSFLVKER
jgi:adenine nucleotide transporter 17